jgi:hypothetical protein
MYTADQAMREVRLESRGDHERGAIVSAFQALETRGASDAEFRSLIWRMEHNSASGPVQLSPDELVALRLCLL